jgi:ATP-binding cassette subfamily B (MDR/TAP) protein 1
LLLYLALSPALDSESEGIVQEALDRIMQSKDHTIIVIAHRLSTVRNADRIAFIAHGGVKEFGSHDELMEKPHGRYKRLVESQKRGSVIDAAALKHSLKDFSKNDDEKEDDEKEGTESKVEEKGKVAFNAKRAREMAKPDASYMLLGSIGALLAGGVFPVWYVRRRSVDGAPLLP